MKELTQVDELTYDVEIYDYIHDQAGNPLTASDIKFCYDTAKESGNLPKLASIESIEVLSDYVCRFRFVELAAGDLYSLLMECPIVTQAAYEASADQMATDPVTTSPYLKEQAYEYGLVAPVVNLAHTDNIKTAVTCFRGQVIPGACEY